MSEPKKRGRPSLYTEAIAAEVCDRLSKGESLVKICESEHMPDMSTVKNWALTDQPPGFFNRYARARDLQADALVDECLTISDTATPAEAQVARLRVDTRKWYAAKVRPGKYGERLALAGDKDSPIVVEAQGALASELVSLLRDLKGKA